MPTQSTSKKPTVKIIAFDISLSSPGAAVVEVSGVKPKLLAVSHVKTDAKQSMVTRCKTIESWAHLFIADNQTPSKPYDVIVRERYAGKFGLAQMFSAHAAIDRALADFNLADTEKPIAQQSVKKAVVGRGRAEKAEVESAVRRLTGFTGEFATDDCSDAVAIALAWAVQNGLIANEITEGDDK